MYRRIANELLATSTGGQGGGQGGNAAAGAAAGEGAVVLRSLRGMLRSVVHTLRQAGDEAACEEFERLLWISHLIAAQAVAAARGAAAASKRLALSMLRYLREVPADRCFYEAGMACRAQADLNTGFVLLNRYLDITEAVEEHEPSSTSLDNSDFAQSPEIPFDFPLPQTQFLDETGREKVRDLALELPPNLLITTY